MHPKSENSFAPKRSTANGKQGREGFKVYVGNINLKTAQPTLRLLFERFGSLMDLFVMPPHEGRPTVYSFVTYRFHDDAASAIYKMNGECIDGNVLRVDWAKLTIVPPPSQRGSTPGSRYPKFYRYRQVQQMLPPINNAANRYVSNRLAIAKEEQVQPGGRKRYPTDQELGFKSYSAAPIPVHSHSSDVSTSSSSSENGVESETSSVDSSAPSVFATEFATAATFLSGIDNIDFVPSFSLPMPAFEGIPLSAPPVTFGPIHGLQPLNSIQFSTHHVPSAHVFEPFGGRNRVSEYGAIGMGRKF
ncbi:RNA-binding domain-containing protein [Atractiella rhizophila]|nr:RNA-binding domain-containing protein [Atractiella rhizophila]